MFQEKCAWLVSDTGLSTEIMIAALYSFDIDRTEKAKQHLFVDSAFIKRILSVEKLVYSFYTYGILIT